MTPAQTPSECPTERPRDPAPVPLAAPRVVVFFRGDEVHPNPVVPLEELLAPKRLECFELPPEEARALASAAAHRLLQAVPMERLARLDDATRRSRCRRGSSRVRLANMRILQAPEPFDADGLAALLNTLPEVELAYVERAIGRPCDTTACAELPDLSGDQRWLEPGPDGLAARFAWGLNGGRGENIPLVVVDAGWNVENAKVCHCDLNAGIPLAWGISGNIGDMQHGMASLGLSVARHDRGGILGIAPNASPVSVCAYRGAPGSLTYAENSTQPTQIAQGLINPWNALAVAIDHLALLAGKKRTVPGVILLEMEVHAPGAATAKDAWSPAEVEPALRALIGVAAGLGITVIEAAGNSGEPVIDTFPSGDLPVGSLVSLAGALLVGAADASRQPLSASNTGPMLDCFAQGAAVPSLSTLEETPRTELTRSFSGTSSASAIVAGAALAAQGLFRAANGRTLSPGRLREHLRATGSPCLDPFVGERRDHIGVQPNLARFAERIGLAPVYFQDFPGHNGQWHSENIGLSSPDILVTEGPPSALDLSAFALNGDLNGGGGVSRAGLSPGGQVHITLRLASRGGAALPDFVIELFAVPENPAPDAIRTPIGVVSIPSLAAAGRTLSESLIWELPAALPAPLLIVAQASSPCFPSFLNEPFPADGADFLTFVQNNPRVTFRRCERKAP